MSNQIYCEICDFQFYEFNTHENFYQRHCEYSFSCSWVFAERASKIFSFTSKTMFTSFATFFINSIKTISKFSLFDTSFSRSFATSKNLSSIETISRSMISSIRLRFSTTTSKNVSKMTKIASMICSSISSSIFSRNSISKHQKQKFYFTINDLFRMFVKKFKKINFLRIRYFIKKNKSFSKFFNQIKIIFYFKFAVNQNKSISQNSKISNSRNFRQRMFAKMTRIKSLFSIKTTSKKSIVSLYKMSSIFRITFMIEFSKFSIKIIYLQIFFQIFFNVCRICNDIFKLNIDLQHIYDRFMSIKRLVEIMKSFARMIERSNAISWLENSWFVNEKTNRFFISLHVLLIDFSWMNRMFSSRDTTKTL